ncbi:MAG: DUF3253 domain-containing protein [Phycisphaerales bacterium]
MNRAPKLCAVCARPITWRKKWERDWENVRFCSDACRRARRSVEQARCGGASIEAEILRRVQDLRPGSTVCPSEIARHISPQDWRGLMPELKNAVRRLAAAGRLRALQGGREVDAATAKGPIRLAGP